MSSSSNGISTSNSQRAGEPLRAALAKAFAVISLSGWAALPPAAATEGKCLPLLACQNDKAPALPLSFEETERRHREQDRRRRELMEQHRRDLEAGRLRRERAEAEREEMERRSRLEQEEAQRRWAAEQEEARRREQAVREAQGREYERRSQEAVAERTRQQVAQQEATEEAARQVVTRLAERRSQAAERAPRFASESGTRWELRTTRDQLTGKASMTVVSRQDTRGLAIEIEGSCGEFGLIQFRATFHSLDQTEFQFVGTTYFDGVRHVTGRAVVNDDPVLNWRFANRNWTNQVVLFDIAKDTAKPQPITIADSTTMASLGNPTFEVLYAILDARLSDPGRRIAAQIVGNDYPQHVTQTLNLVSATWAFKAEIGTFRGPVIVQIPFGNSDIQKLMSVCPG